MKTDYNFFDDNHNRYRSALIRYFKRNLSCHKDIDDLVQITFLKVWQYTSHNGNSISKPDAFLWRTARNVLIDYLRASRPYVPLESLTLSTDTPIIETIHIKDALNKLDYIDKEILLLRYSGYKFSEISLLLNVNESTLRTRFMQAKRRLKRLLG